jgi:hypothetical protein
MGFDPYNCSLKIRESTETPTPKMGAHLGVWVSILTLPTSLLAHALVSHCLGHEPNVKVASYLIFQKMKTIGYISRSIVLFCEDHNYDDP